MAKPSKPAKAKKVGGIRTPFSQAIMSSKK